MDDLTRHKQLAYVKRAIDREDRQAEADLYEEYVRLAEELLAADDSVVRRDAANALREYRYWLRTIRADRGVPLIPAQTQTIGVAT